MTILLVAISPAVPVFVGAALAILGGLVGAAGWLTGGVRKSVAEARDRDIAALDHRVQVLEAQNARLELALRDKNAALSVIIEQVRGTAEIQFLTATLSREHHEILGAITALGRAK